MEINRMLLGIVMIVFSLALTSSVLLPSASGNSGDSFNVDMNLPKGKPSPVMESGKESTSSVWYDFPDNYQFDVSNSSIVCPSNQCKITEDEMIFKTDDNDGSMSLYGDFNIVDDKSNGNFGPKKQNLIEKNVLYLGY